MPTPYQIAKDTWILQQIFPVPLAGNIFVNSMIIAGSEPVIVDTGPSACRADWLKQAWSIVDPKDVRWIYLSHDDGDHVGNLEAVLEACPDAKLVTGWFATGRLAVDQGRELPVPRCLWINDGDSFDAGDRRLLAVRPPVFDCPTTRGLFDPTTGVYWAADAFCLFVPHAVEDAAELDSDLRWQAFYDCNRLLAPWHTLLDPGKFGDHVGAVESLGVSTIASCHAPSFRGSLVSEAFRRIRELPSLPPYHEPDQSDLDTLLAQAMEQQPVAATGEV